MRIILQCRNCTESQLMPTHGQLLKMEHVNFFWSKQLTTFSVIFLVDALLNQFWETESLTPHSSASGSTSTEDPNSKWDWNIHIRIFVCIWYFIRPSFWTNWEKAHSIFWRICNIQILVYRFAFVESGLSEEC